jgi:VCBS repeat-containing protein
VHDVDLGPWVFATPSSLSGTYGTFTFNETSGEWTYHPDNSLAATQALVGGEAVSDTLTVTSLDGSPHQDIVVAITGTNDAPDAVDDNGFTTAFETPLTIDPATLLANDTDVDSTNLTITAVDSAVGGTVELVQGQIVFTPAAGFSGDASFHYHLSDGSDGTDVATVSLTVGQGEDDGCITGTDGNDDMTGTNDADCMDGLGGDDRLLALNGNDTLNGGDGDDTLLAGNGDDVLDGGAGNNTLTAGPGNDLLLGGAGDDVMTGGSENDVIVGGLGLDHMVGSTGQDVFRFDAIADFGVGFNNHDVINTFQKGSDLLDFRPLGLTAANVYLTMIGGAGTLVDIDYNLDTVVDAQLEVNGAFLDMSDILL